MKPAKAFLVTVLLSFVAAAQLSRNDVLWIGSPWSREEIIRMMGFVPLTKPFRSAYQYQNIMFTAAGESVAAVSGGAWEAFINVIFSMRLE